MSIIEKAVDKMMGKEGDPDSPASQRVSEEPVPGAPTEKTVRLEEESKGRVAEALSQEASEQAQLETPAEHRAPSAGGGAGEPPAPRGGDGQLIPLRSMGLEGILSPDQDRNRSAEEYRLIKRPLLTRAFGSSQAGDAHRNLIMLTSSVEGEGKTFTSLNLAISIAMEMDRTVLLVDADLAKPGLSRLLKVNNLPGLTDRLIDESIDLRSLLLRTDIPKLTVLPAGRRHRRSTELLASNTMRRLLDELALRYPDRVVLFDSPPLLATTEAAVLGQQMGQIGLVVESAVTPQFLIKDALKLLESTDNLSLILNKCTPDFLLSKYGYGYGHSYGYGYGYGYGYDNGPRQNSADSTQ